MLHFFFYPRLAVNGLLLFSSSSILGALKGQDLELVHGLYITSEMTSQHI